MPCVKQGLCHVIAKLRIVYINKQTHASRKPADDKTRNNYAMPTAIPALLERAKN